MEYHIKVAISH